jgi:hypothetical protein
MTYSTIDILQCFNWYHLTYMCQSWIIDNLSILISKIKVQVSYKYSKLVCTLSREVTL